MATLRYRDVEDLEQFRKDIIDHDKLFPIFKIARELFKIIAT